MSHLMHYQADRIELVLASHKVPARVLGGTITPRLVRHQLGTLFGIEVKQVASLPQEIAPSLADAIDRARDQPPVSHRGRRGTRPKWLIACRPLHTVGCSRRKDYGLEVF